MPDCECLSKCPFFNDKMADMPSTAGIYKKRYCQGDFGQCARYRVFRALGREAVPADLFPNQGKRADQILQAQ